MCSNKNGMKIIISGKGIAGLATGCFLSKLPFVKEIVYLEKSCSDHHVQNKYMYTGIWNPANYCLNYLGINVSSIGGYNVDKSCYYNQYGQHLAAPLIGLHPYINSTRPSLTFIRNDILLTCLKEALSTSKATVVTTVVEDTHDVTRDDSSRSIIVNCKSGNSYTADLLIACDGTHSPIRECMYGTKSIENRGYYVYRGHSKMKSAAATTVAGSTMLSTRISEQGFQSWGPGMRFATVPTIEGNAWFATVNLDSVADSDKCDITVDNGSLINRSHHISSDEYVQLMSKFADWHHPIPQLFSDNDGIEFVTRCKAVAHNTVTKYGHNSDLSSSVVFVGDSRFTVDPILAQGAGIAIETSAVLAVALLKLYNSDDTASTSTDSSHFLSYIDNNIHRDEAGHHKHDNRVFQDLNSVMDKMLSNRFNNAHILSNLSQSIGSIDSPYICNARDMIIRAVPSSIKERMFDILIAKGTESIVK